MRCGACNDTGWVIQDGVREECGFCENEHPPKQPIGSESEGETEAEFFQKWEKLTDKFFPPGRRSQ